MTTASSAFARRFAVVNGITLPTPYGGTVRTVMVDLDPQALQAKGLSPRDVNDAINVQNLVLPSGRARIADVDYRVNLNNSPAVVDRLNDIPIKTVNGIPVYVRDVAFVHDGAATQTNIVRTNGVRGTLLTILRNGNASTLDIVNGVKKTDAVDPGQRAARDEDQPALRPIDFVTHAIESVLHEGLIAGCLTGAMILLFLGSWRSTFIVLISIPLSILASVTVLSALGYSINVMTLGGLALAIGILVDDATVEIENIHRNLAMGKPLQQVDPRRRAADCHAGLRRHTLDLYRLRARGAPRRPGEIPFRAVRTGRRLRRLHQLHSLPHHRAGDGEIPAARGIAYAGKFDADRFLQPHPERLQRRLRKIPFRLCQRARLGARASRGDAARLRVDHRQRLHCAAVDRRDFFPTVDAGQIRMHVVAASGTRLEETEKIFSAVEAEVRKNHSRRRPGHDHRTISVWPFGAV